MEKYHAAESLVARQYYFESFGSGLILEARLACVNTIIPHNNPTLKSPFEFLGLQHKGWAPPIVGYRRDESGNHGP